MYPLHEACKFGEMRRFSDFIGSVDINSTDSTGNTPLICACKGDQLEIATTLIDLGADISFQSKVFSAC
jgi:ankyrin repeat protein